MAMVIYALVARLVVWGAALMLGEGRFASVAHTDSVQTHARQRLVIDGMSGWV
jgi:hypothetical protein